MWLTALVIHPQGSNTKSFHSHTARNERWNYFCNLCYFRHLKQNIVTLKDQGTNQFKQPLRALIWNRLLLTQQDLFLLPRRLATLPLQEGTEDPTGGGALRGFFKIWAKSLFGRVLSRFYTLSKTLLQRAKHQNSFYSWQWEATVLEQKQKVYDLAASSGSPKIYSPVTLDFPYMLAVTTLCHSIWGLMNWRMLTPLPLATSRFTVDWIILGSHMKYDNVASRKNLPPLWLTGSRSHATVTSLCDSSGGGCRRGVRAGVPSY